MALPTKEELLEELSQFSREELNNFIQNSKRQQRIPKKSYSFMKLRPNKKKTHNILPIIPPTTIDIPEVYVISETGSCLFSFNFAGEFNKEQLSQDLFTNFLGAMQLFTENMGWEEGVKSLKSGDYNIHFKKGKYIFVALLSKLISDKSAYQVEPVLADLAEITCVTFESEYEDLLFEGITNNISQFNAFKSEVEKILVDYRKENFSIYQKLILVEAINNKVPEEKIAPLIAKISNGKSVIGELGQLMAHYGQIEEIIGIVNLNYLSMWQIFSTPIYQI